MVIKGVITQDRPGRLCIRRAAWVCVLVLVTVLAGTTPAGAQTEKSSSVYSLSTVVVYNTAVPESRDLATFYAEARGIPAGNVIALTCPDREQINRKEYQDTIEKPLRDAFTGNNWWRVSLDTENGIRVLANRIHLIVLVYGVPLKVSNDIPAPAPTVDPKTGKEVRPPRPPFETSACSIDSELTVLAQFNLSSKGPVKNPYHKQAGSFYQARIPGMMMVGRVDGPTAAVAKRTVVDAIAVEETGLWGFAFVDQAQKIKEGDGWLAESADTFRREGIPVVEDLHRSRFAENYPMRNASLYFGWYAFDVDGPFLNPGFRFKRGAVACHLHSYSAETLRSTTQKWVGPLLNRGAAASLGNVYEPYLSLTHHFDIFNARLLSGYTFVEAAYMAIPALSWMNVAVGDPLYRPFATFNTFNAANYGKDEDAPFKAMRLARKRWGEDPAVLREKLEEAAEKLESGEIYEGIALEAAEELKFLKAEAFLDEAFDLYTAEEDKLRMLLHRADFARRQGKVDEAIRVLETVTREYASLPESQAAVALILELRPPPPPAPPPPGG